MNRIISDLWHLREGLRDLPTWVKLLTTVLLGFALEFAAYPLLH